MTKRRADGGPPCVPGSRLQRGRGSSSVLLAASLLPHGASRPLAAQTPVSEFSASITACSALPTTGTGGPSSFRLADGSYASTAAPPPHLPPRTMKRNRASCSGPSSSEWSWPSPREGGGGAPGQDLPRDARAVLRPQHPGRRRRQGRPLRGTTSSSPRSSPTSSASSLQRERRPLDGAGHGDGRRSAERGRRRVSRNPASRTRTSLGLARRRDGGRCSRRRAPTTCWASARRIWTGTLHDVFRAIEAQRAGPPARVNIGPAPVFLFSVTYGSKNYPDGARGGAAAPGRSGDRPEPRADLERSRRPPATRGGLRAPPRGRQRRWPFTAIGFATI